MDGRERIAGIVNVPVGSWRPGLLDQRVVVVEVDAGALPGLRRNLPDRWVQHELPHARRGLPQVDRLHKDLAVVAALLPAVLVVEAGLLHPHRLPLLLAPRELRRHGLVHRRAPLLQLRGAEQGRDRAPAVVLVVLHLRGVQRVEHHRSGARRDDVRASGDGSRRLVMELQQPGDGDGAMESDVMARSSPASN